MTFDERVVLHRVDTPEPEGNKGVFSYRWFRVQGSGFRVQGSGFRVQGSRFRVQGSGLRVWSKGLGFMVWGLECNVCS